MPRGHASTQHGGAMPSPKALAIFIMTLGLIVYSLILIVPVVGGHNSACDHDPYAAGCR
jgi:hypothetical protein